MDLNNLKAKASIRIRRPPSDVFTTFTDPSKMSKFWFSRRDAGLTEGETCSWFIGSAEDASSFDVLVTELAHPHKLVIAWENGGGQTKVAWTIEETEEEESILTIEESGFSGSSDSILERVLDSTGGFNQVIVAAKALIEHGVELNVVKDHA